MLNSILLAASRAIHGGKRIGVTGIILVYATFVYAAQWTQPQVLNSYAYVDNGADDKQPRLATNGANELVCVWLKNGKLVSSHSMDNGNTWSPEFSFESNIPGFFLDINLSYAGNDVWLCNLITGETSGLNSQVFSLRSTDNGKTWSVPYRVDIGMGYESNFENSLSVASDNAGHSLMVWHLNGPNGYLLAKTFDYGQSWTVPVPVDLAPNLDQKVTIKLAYARNNKWVIVCHARTGVRYYQSFKREYNYGLSVDFGATWNITKTFVLSPNGDLFYSLADIYATDNAVVVTVSGGTIFTGAREVVISLNGGSTWENTSRLDGVPIDLFGFPLDGLLTGNENGDWLLAVNDNTDIIGLPTTDILSDWNSNQVLVAGSPAFEGLHSLIANNQGDFFACFTSASLSQSAFGTESDILITRSSDGGQTWGAPVYVNYYGSKELPLINDSEVCVASNRHGTVVAVWSAKSGPTDKIIYAQSVDSGQTWGKIDFLQTNHESEFRLDSNPIVKYKNGTEWTTNWQTETAANFLATSIDDGNSWGTPEVHAYDADDPMRDRAGNGLDTIVEFYEEPGSSGEQYSFNLMTHRSFDGGASWTTPILIATLPTNSISYSQNRGYSHVQVRWLGSATWLAVWQTQITPPTNPLGIDSSQLRLEYTVTLDSGDTWSPVQFVADKKSAVGQVAPSLTVTGSGDALVAWKRLAGTGASEIPYGIDSEVLYSTITLPTSSAPSATARDWTLYE